MVSDRLESSSRLATTAEKLFLQAKQEGDKEAAKYLKNYNPTPSSAAATPIPKATVSAPVVAAAPSSSINTDSKSLSSLSSPSFARSAWSSKTK